MLSVLSFLLILSVLVLLHELGHYLVARAFGVRAYEFGFGFPPRAIGFVREKGKWKMVTRKDETEYESTIWSLNWLPLGGFVRLKGESADDASDKDSLTAKSGWKKFAVLAAGVSMNWLLAATIFSFGFMIGVPAITNDLPESAIVSNQHVEIVDVVADSAASKAGIKPGDALQSIDGVAVSNADNARIQLGTHTNLEETLALGVMRDGQSLSIETKPAFLKELNRAGLGVALSDIGTVRFPALLAIGEGVSQSVRFTGMIVSGFGTLIHDLVLGKGPSADLSGPVGIAVMTGSIVEQGTWPVLQFMAVLSLNLAVINFLPIPALDGGRALFVITEAIRRKKNNAKLEMLVNQWGMVGLLILVALVTLNDIRRFFIH